MSANSSWTATGTLIDERRLLPVCEALARELRRLRDEMLSWPESEAAGTRNVGARLARIERRLRSITNTVAGSLVSH